MRVTVDPRACAGSGQCALAVPEVFDQDGADGTVLLIEERPRRELHGVVREAVERCPVSAIAVAES